MAKWVIHDKWAIKLGMPQGMSKQINILVDFPTENLEFVNFANKKGANIAGSSGENIGSAIAGIAASHDSGRRDLKKDFGASFKLEFLQQKGADYVKAWYLHHALDHINETIFKKGKYMDPKETLRESFALGMLDQLTRPSYESEVIKRFVLDNFDEIFEDCRP